VRRSHRQHEHHGKHRKRKRGAHERAGSPETLLWERELLIPECPPWLPPEVYTQLADLRRSL